MTPQELLAERPKVAPSVAQVLSVAGIYERPTYDGETAVRASRIEAEIALMRASDALRRAEVRRDSGSGSENEYQAARDALREAESALSALK